MNISVTRALAEHKLIDKKILSLTGRAKFMTLSKKDGATVDGNTIEQFGADAQSAYDQLRSLLKQKASIKSAIIMSNAVTEVTIAGKTMKVAEAIERKNSIAFDKQVLETMRSNFVSTKSMYEREKANVESKLDAYLNQLFGASKATAKAEDIQLLSETYVKNNMSKLIDPIELEKKIVAMEAEINEFDKDVDFSLSESNTRTDIEVEL